ncbi:MAG: hypothetical protein E7K65_04640, partial [Pseudomonas sp.]|nr:hypothetical protein [Pseudomonas sp.]
RVSLRAAGIAQACATRYSACDYIDISVITSGVSPLLKTRIFDGDIAEHDAPACSQTIQKKR